MRSTAIEVILLTITIDWIAVTFKDFYDGNGELKNGAQEFIREFASDGTIVPTPPHNGYTTSTTDQNCVSVSWNDDRPEMGHHAVFSGSALRNLVERNGISSEAILRACITAHGNLTRLDIAKDLVGPQDDIKDIYKSLQQNGNRGTAITWNEINKNDGGYTLYIGARSSEKYIRIYNKAAESGLSDVIWSRFEIETKGKTARALATSLFNRASFCDVFDTVATAMVRPVQCRSYEQFFSDRNPAFALPKIERKADREAWIETQVLPAVAKHYIDNPNSEAVTRLIETLNLIDRQRKM